VIHRLRNQKSTGANGPWITLRCSAPSSRPTFAVDGDEEAPKLAAGALIMAATQMIDELFQDIETLARDRSTSVVDSEGAYFVLEELPQRFAGQYNGRFARNFHVAAVMITGRLSAERWMPPASVAEALALYLVIQRAQYLLVDHEFVDREQARGLYLGFEDAAFEDVDHEWLYRADMDGFENDEEFAARFGTTDMRVQSWFQPIGDGPAHVHAFSVDLEAPEQM
jgi:hypothetical protein